MKLYIFLTYHQATLELRDGQKRVDTVDFDVDNDLASHILTQMEVFLKKNNIEPLSLEGVETSAQECGFTTERIAQAVANAYNFARNNA